MYCHGTNGKLIEHSFQQGGLIKTFLKGYNCTNKPLAFWYVNTIVYITGNKITKIESLCFATIELVKITSAL